MESVTNENITLVVAVEVAAGETAAAAGETAAAAAVTQQQQKKTTPRRKNRTKAEIENDKQVKVAKAAQRKQAAAAKQAVIEEKKQARLAKANAPVVQLPPGVGLDAQAAMRILDHCRGKANNAFRRMIAMRKIFNPAENINKFMTGGGAEEILHQLITSVGYDCTNVSAKATVIDLVIMVPDLVVPAQASGGGGGEDTAAAGAAGAAAAGAAGVAAAAAPLYRFAPSLKNSGNINGSPILENYRGKKRAEIRPLPPTFIIYTEVALQRVRVVYLDHEIVVSAYPTLTAEEIGRLIYKNEDSNLTFQSGFLKDFIPRLPNEYILTADYPTDLPALKSTNIVLLALAEVDQQLAEADAAAAAALVVV